MFKINKICNIMLAIFSAFFLVTSSVSAKTITVHYNNSDGNRIPTLTAIQNSMSSQHTVNGYNNVGNSSALSQLQNSAIFVAHHHGSPGRQFLKNQSNGIVGTNGNGSSYKAISSLSVNMAKPLFIAIYYGCETGKTTSSYGNIMSQTTSKVAKSAIAWEINTQIDDVNIWNKYFFQKGQTLSSTGAAALTYADTKLSVDSGAIAAADMKDRRVSSGTFGWTFSDIVFS